MRLLVDTHVMLWAMTDSPRLSKRARRALEGAEARFVSAASLWEVAIKVALGKLHVDLDELVSLLAEAGFAELPVTWEHTRAVATLPTHHRDPFDRLLVAQATTEPLGLLTHDQTLSRYSQLVILV